MTSLLQILPEVAAVVVIVCAILFVVLAFRDPFRPNWLRWNWMAVAASLLVAVAVSFGFGLMISGGVAAGFGAGTMILMTIAVAGGAGFVVARGVGIGERLRRSDAGQSPFYPLAAPKALRSVWQRQFGKGVGA